MSASDHRKFARIHARQRARQRFNAGPELLQSLRRVFRKRRKMRERKAYVRDGRPYYQPVDDADYITIYDGPDRTKARITVDGVVYVAVFDHRLNTVVTVYPPDKPKGGDSSGGQKAQEDETQGLQVKAPVLHANGAADHSAQTAHTGRAVQPPSQGDRR